MNAEEVVRKYASKEYGQFILADSPIYDQNSKRYYSNLKSDFPLFIHDDRNPSEYKVRILKIQSIGGIFLNNKLQIIRNLTTNGEKCHNNLETLIKLWREQAENIVVSCSADNFMRIEEFKNHFTLVEMIIDHLKEFDRITPLEIKRYTPKKNQERLIRYLELLEGLEIVRKETYAYIPGRQFALLEEVTTNEDELKHAILTYLIQNRYITLRDVFKLTILEKTIGIDNVIYLPELEVGEPIYRRRNTISNRYWYYYNRRINPIRLTHILKRLEKCDAICRKGDNYFGDNQLRESMLEKKRELPPLTITPLSRYI